MQFIKKSFSLLILVFGVLVICAGSAYFLVLKAKDSILRQVLTQVNKQFPGKLTLQGTDVSLLAQFPFVSLKLNRIQFFSGKDTTTTPIYAFETVYLGLNILDLWRGEYRLKRMDVQGGVLNLVKFADGSFNLMNAKGIAIADTTTTESATLTLDIEKAHFQKLTIWYHDVASNQDVVSTIEDADIALSIGGTTIDTQLSASFILDIDQNGRHTFFHDKHIRFQTSAKYDKASGKATFQKIFLELEKASFLAEGTINTNDSLYADIRFRGDKPSLSTFAAFAPPSVAAALDRYKNSGKIVFEGSVKGWLLSKNLPAFRVDFQCENAAVINTAVNKKVDAIHFIGSITNGSNATSSVHGWKYAEFRLLNIRAKPDVGLFRGNIVIRNFEDPYINVGVNADVDLEFLAEFLGIEGLKRLKGQVLVDMNFNELVDIAKPDETLLRLKEGIESELTIKNLTVDVPNFPHRIENINGHAVMKNGAVTLDDLSLKIAESDIHFDGTFNNIPGLFHAKNEELGITLNAKSNRLNMAQILAFDSTLSAKYNEEITNLVIRCEFQTRASELRSFQTLPKGEFLIHNISAQFKGYPHNLHDVKADVIVDDHTLTVKDVTAIVDGSDIHLTAQVENYEKWLQPVKRGESTLRIALTSEYFSLKDVLSYNGRNFVPIQYQSEEIRGLALKASLTSRFDSVFRSFSARLENLRGSFKLHDMKLRNAVGLVHYDNGRFVIDTLRAVVGNSDFGLKGSFLLDSSKRLITQSAQLLQSSSRLGSANPLLENSPVRFELSAKTLDVDQLLTMKKNAVTLFRSGASLRQGNDKNSSRIEKKQESGKKEPSKKEPSKSNENPLDSVRHASAFNLFRLPFPDAVVSLNVQTMLYKGMRLSDVVLKLRTQANHQCFVDTLAVSLAGGIVGMKGELNAADAKNILFKTRIYARSLDITKVLLKLDNFGKDMALTENLTGTVSGGIEAEVALHPDATPILQKSIASMNVIVKQGELINFAPLQAMKRFFQDKNLNRVRFDTLRNSLTLSNGKLIIPRMTIASSLGFIEIQGEQSIQRSSGFSMNYTVGVPLSHLAKAGFGLLFGGSPRDSIPSDRIDAIRYRPADCNQMLLKMRLSGKPGNYTISPGW